MTEKVVPELMNTREVARYLGIKAKAARSHKS